MRLHSAKAFVHRRAIPHIGTLVVAVHRPGPAAAGTLVAVVVDTALVAAGTLHTAAAAHQRSPVAGRVEVGCCADRRAVDGCGCSVAAAAVPEAFAEPLHLQAAVEGWVRLVWAAEAEAPFLAPVVPRNAADSDLT